MFLNPKVTVDSVHDLFIHLESHIEKIPEEERYNLHYTLCKCHDEKKPRVFHEQNIIPFDIDGIDTKRIDEYHAPILEAIGSLNGSDVAIVNSGRGIHYLIRTDFTINSPEYFKETRKYYKLICDRINRKLESLNLPGETDTAVWAAGHTMRLPGTKNIKTPDTGYPDLNFEGKCELITRVMNPLPITVVDLAGGQVDDSQVVAVRGKAVGGKYLADTPGVLDGCEFLKFCNQNQEQIKEPQWYAALSVLSHLDKGRELCHRFSNRHPGYNPSETDAKIDQALTCTGPRTCENIATLWDGCKNGKHFNKITSPITIKSDNYIKTLHTGFREVQVKKIGEDPGGQPQYIEVPGKIIYEDLRRYFEQQHIYCATESRIVYTYNGTNWEILPDIYLEAFCQDHVKPAPNNTQCNEFKRLVFRTNLVRNEWFVDTTFKKLNLKNGVLDLAEEPKLLPHSEEFGFLSTLDYEYDPKAECPKFDTFMKEITVNRQDLTDVLLEFAGYAFSNERCLYAKALILLGDGANGKSTFLNILKQLAGKDTYSSLSAKDLESEQQRAQLQGKLFNLAEETPTRAFVDSSIFKNIVSGGSIPIKIIYKEPYSIEPRAKMMMAANELPRTGDTSKGFFRRLLLVPFDAEFSDHMGNKDIFIEDKLITEASGILNRILEGYQRLKKQRQFTDSAVVRESLQEYRRDTDTILGFVKSRLEVIDYEHNTHEMTEFSKIYQEYKSYCEEFCFKIMEGSLFSRKLTNYIPYYKARKTRKGKHKTTSIKGVSLIARDTDF